KVSGDHWRLPEKGWVKLNTNGALLGSNNIAAIGGVFRDHDANWTCEFTMRIGKDSIFKTEHIPREHNRVADWITKLGNSNYDEMHVFEEAPILLWELLKIDLNPICRDINW
ncbi:hypothetical protein Gotri_021427, partial [Gossypium trilobum]|nr:hypothetical protein [Gossypium trilobum]